VSSGEQVAAGTSTERTQEESEEELSGEDDEAEGAANVGGARLPSAAAAFASVEEDDLEFKKFERAQKKEKRIRSHEMSLDRIPAMASATLRGQGWDPTAEASVAAHPEAASESVQQGPDDAKGKGKGKMTVKERTKLKRFKGQSGEDHSGRVWKPEAWMNLRAQFD